MLHNYCYKVTNCHQTVGSLAEARKLQKYLIKIDKKSQLLSDKDGIYILKVYTNGKESKRIY